MGQCCNGAEVQKLDEIGVPSGSTANEVKKKTAPVFAVEAAEAGEKEVQTEAADAEVVLLPKRRQQKIVTQSMVEMAKIAKARDRGHRDAVSAESVNQGAIDNFVKPVYEKTPAEQAKLSEFIRKNEKFGIIAGSITDEGLKDIVNALYVKSFNGGVDVIKQGDEGNCLYVCEEGELEVFVNRPDPDTGEFEPGKGDKVLDVGPGALFGELALMYSSPRAATITVKSATAKLWSLDQIPFKMLLVSNAKFEPYSGFLRDIELLKPLNDHEVGLISNMMESDLFDGDEEIVKQGDDPEKFWMVEDGTCGVFVGDREIHSYGVGDYFGDVALLTNEPQRATVKGTGDGCSVVSCSKEDFDQHFGPVQEQLKKNIATYAIS